MDPCHQRVPAKPVARELFKDQKLLATRQKTHLEILKHQQENVGVPFIFPSKRQSGNAQNDTSTSSSLELLNLGYSDAFRSSRSYRSLDGSDGGRNYSQRIKRINRKFDDTVSTAYSIHNDVIPRKYEQLREYSLRNLKSERSSSNGRYGSNSLSSMNPSSYSLHDGISRDHFKIPLPNNKCCKTTERHQHNQSSSKVKPTISHLSTKRKSHFHKDVKNQHKRECVAHDGDIPEPWLKQENAPMLSSSLPMTLNDLLEDKQEQELLENNGKVSLRYPFHSTSVILNDHMENTEEVEICNEGHSIRNSFDSSSMTLKDLEDEEEVLRNPDDYLPGRSLSHHSSSKYQNKLFMESNSWSDSDSFLPEYSLRLQNLLVDDIEANRPSPRQISSPMSKSIYRTDDEDINFSNGVLLSPNTSPTGCVSRRTSPRRTASLLWVFKLLDILHCVPAEQQNQLITKAYWLRRWKAYVRKVKGERLQYVEQQQRATHFHNMNIKEKVFKAWLNVNLEKKTNADRIHEYHLKTKGLKALQYFLIHSRLDDVKATDFHTTAILKSYFFKWQVKYQAMKQKHLKNVFQKWEQAKLEKERQRIVQQLAVKQTQSKFFKKWREQYETNNKERIATLYYKVGLLSRYFAFWRIAVQHKRAAQQDVEKAKIFQSSRVRGKLLRQWRLQTSKSLLAKKHYSGNVLLKIFLGLRRAVQVSRVERLEENSKALEFRRTWLCRHCLATWRRSLIQQRFQKQMQRKQISRAFQIWCLKLRRSHIRGRLVSALANKSLLRRYFTVWCTRVKEAQQKQIYAINSLSHLRTKHVFQKWLQVTQQNMKLREKLQEFLKTKETSCKNMVLTHWKSLHTTRQAWSLKCVRNACNVWISSVKQRKVERIFNQSQSRIENNLVKVYFHSWLLAKKQIDANTKKALSAKKSMNRNLLHQLLLDWRLKTRRSKVIAPVRLRQDKKLLCRVFLAWSGWAATQSRHKKKLIVFQQHKLHRIFCFWKYEVELLLKEKKVKDKLLERRIHQVIHGWNCVVIRHKQQTQFQHSMKHRQMARLYSLWKDKYERVEMNRETHRGKKLREFIVKLTTMKNWRRVIKEQQEEENAACERLKLLQDCNRKKSALSIWRRRHKCQQIARENWNNFQVRRLHKMLITWHQHAHQQLQESLTRFSLAVLSQCFVEDTNEDTDHSNNALTNELEYHNSPVHLLNKLTFSRPLVLPSSSSQSFEDQLGTEEVDMVDEPDGWLENVELLTDEHQKHSVERLRSQSWSSGQRSWISTSGQRSWMSTSGQMSLGDSAILNSKHTFSEELFAESNDRLICNEKGDALGGRSFSSLDDSGHCLTTSSIHSGAFSSRQGSIPDLPVRAYTVVRLKKIILHWKLWPVSVAFKQWLKYTQDRKRLRLSQYQMQLRCKQLQQRAVFPYWLQQANLMRQAREHHDTVLMSNCLHKLSCYQQQRQKKRRDTERALGFSQHSQLLNCFDRWRIKLLENQKITGVMHTWKEYMGWSEDAERKVQVMTGQLKRATVKECLYIWRIKHKQLQMVDQYKNNVLIRRCLLGWLNQSMFQLNSRKKMQQFREQKLLKTTFTKWKLKLHIAYMASYNRQCRHRKLLTCMLQSWCCHTKKMSSLRTVASKVQLSCNNHTKHAFFLLWKQQTQKMQKATNVSNVKLLQRCLTGWHQEARKRVQQEVCLQRLRSNSLSSVLRENFMLWKQRTENQKILKSTLKEKRERRMKEAMGTWKELVRLSRADRHHRHGLLRKTIKLWKRWILVHQQTEQKLRHVVSHWRTRVNRSKLLEVHAVTLESSRHSKIQQRGFDIWKEATVKNNRAVAHSRCMAMRSVFKAWFGFAKYSQEKKRQVAEFKQKRLQGNAWRLWKQRMEEDRMLKTVSSAMDQTKLKHAFNAWHMHTRKQKELATKTEKFKQHLLNLKLKKPFKIWKESTDKIVVMKRQAESVALVRLMLLRERAFLKWKQGAFTQKALRFRNCQLMKSVFYSWKKLCREEREKKQHNKDLEELADWHYQRRLRKVVLKGWYYEIKIQVFRKSCNQQLQKQALSTWIERTSQSLMAKQMVQYKLYSRFWKQWRMALATNRVMKNMDHKTNNQISLQVFSSWQRLSNLQHYGNHLHRRNSQEVLKTSFSKWKEVFNSLSSSANSSPSPPTDNNSSCSSELAAIWEL